MAKLVQANGDSATKVLGCDIGGANLKFADHLEYARSLSFPLWKHPEQLASVLTKEFQAHSHLDKIAITMTGELADCFEDSNQGVRWILDAIDQAIISTHPQVQLLVYSFDGWMNRKLASEIPEKIAAANWHAIARFLSGELKLKNGLLIDCGSTTTDLTCVQNGRIEGLSDFERLSSGSLIYEGVRRTPLMGLARAIRIDGREVAIANELFATTEDVHIVLGELCGDESVPSSDGRNKSEVNCRRRIARMLCSDLNTLSRDSIEQIARQFESIQLAHLADAIEKQMQTFLSPSTQRLEPELESGFKFVISGEGEFLLRKAIRQVQFQAGEFEIVSVANRLTNETSSCLGAFAVASLAANQDAAIENGMGVAK